MDIFHYYSVYVLKKEHNQWWLRYCWYGMSSSVSETLMMSLTALMPSKRCRRECQSFQIWKCISKVSDDSVVSETLLIPIKQRVKIYSLFYMNTIKESTLRTYNPRKKIYKYIYLKNESALTQTSLIHVFVLLYTCIWKRIWKKKLGYDSCVDMGPPHEKSQWQKTSRYSPLRLKVADVTESLKIIRSFSPNYAPSKHTTLANLDWRNSPFKAADWVVLSPFDSVTTRLAIYGSDQKYKSVLNMCTTPHPPTPPADGNKKYCKKENKRLSPCLASYQLTRASLLLQKQLLYSYSTILFRYLYRGTF
jgi:hypothetical protein